MPRTPKFFLAVLLTSSASAQTSAPSVAQTPSASPTIQTRSNLVIEDVVVTDRAGNPVLGLQRSDFAVTEKGKPQQIRTFDEHATSPPTPPQPPLDLPPGVFTNYAPVPNSAALNVLLLDTLNTPLQDQAYARQQLLKYIRTAPAGQRLAIFGLTTHLILLQGFTSDPAILRAAIDRKSLRASQILDNPTTGAPGQELADTINDIAASTGGTQGAAIAQASANMRQFEADNAAFRLEVRARYTLEALGVLGRYLSALPGRKNVLWFSGSFPINIFPDTTLGDPFRATADLSGDLKNTANILTRAQVAVYPIDARGLFNDPTFDASNDGSALSRPGGAALALQKFSQQTAAEHATMREMAQQTGGRAFLNTNDLAHAVASAINDGSNFYTITYTPADAHLDGTFRKVELKLQGARAAQGLSLAYRHGYFAVDPAGPAPRRRLPSPSASPTAGSGAPEDPSSSSKPGMAPGTPPASVPPASAGLHAAMLRGAPPATDVIFKAGVLPSAPASSPPDPNVVPGNQPNPKLAKAPFRTFAVDFAAFPSQLLTRNAIGNYAGILRFITIAYNADGEAVNLVDQTTSVNITPATYQRSAHSGILFHQLISVPVKGEFYLRLGIADLTTDRTGSIEVPVSAIKNLPPLALPAPPSAPTAPPTP